MNQETSKYSVNLSEEDLTRYREKLKLATGGEQLPDPYTLKEKWTNDISSLPEITWRNVTEYLIDTPSAHTKKSIKACKSLEAYDYFVCSHLQNCYYHEISPESKFCFIKTQVHISSLWVMFQKWLFWDLWSKSF